jgi:hypothetical protein
MSEHTPYIDIENLPAPNDGFLVSADTRPLGCHPAGVHRYIELGEERGDPAPNWLRAPRT